ncbi:MAG: hypothetical protein HF314_17550 [Ignavibacteria bacterium]|jgi:DNA uptake protein ComE-like DNA-binding protein|nr:hypothetical protein [Ignavibacteria bacterium]MCU7504892.1 hypothetical protein [Ignavibacteria bacterium]MCU7517849.1 hypothetical protein [Ignavibacteria bacterium]
MGDKGRGSQFMSHSYLGQNTPENFKHGKHGISPVNLNTDDLKRIADIPLIGDYRAKDIIARRPFKSWDEVAKIPGITKEMIEVMKSGRATIE